MLKAHQHPESHPRIVSEVKVPVPLLGLNKDQYCWDIWHLHMLPAQLTSSAALDGIGTVKRYAPLVAPFPAHFIDASSHIEW